jgi:4'-phosphopantetheinyl transferase
MTSAELTSGEVRVWRVALDQPSRPLLELLSTDERSRAERFVFDLDRDRFIVSRATLRRLLARSLGVVPSSITFQQGQHGKPALATFAELRFNVSHSGDRGLVALAVGREVGVDIERVRTSVNPLEIAARFFSPVERAALEALSPADRRDAFFACWTRKEAYLKALGLGLSLPLDSFDVEVRPSVPAALLRTGHDSYAINRWSMYSLTVDPGYAASLVVEGRTCQVTCDEWRE